MLGAVLGQERLHGDLLMHFLHGFVNRRVEAVAVENSWAGAVPPPSL